MRRYRKGISILLLFCIMLSLLPSVQWAKGAGVIRRYELDTDGIDVGATYLIVNTNSAGAANALKFYYSSNNSRDLRNQTLSVLSDGSARYIETGFTGEADCQFQFSGATTGRITHGNYTVDLANSRYATNTNVQTLTFTHVGNGQYRISYGYYFTTYYLRYSNSDWARSSTSSTVYLYKLTETVVGCNVTFDGNGYTGGTLPANAEMLTPGESYTLPAPPVELRKDIGDDTWLFLCWNTKADGTGIEYKPGDTIIVDEDITLYADWYQQTKHAVSMITYLDGNLTDVDKIAGVEKQFFAKLEGTDTYIPLNKTAEGTYTAKVVANGTYVIYAKVGDGDYEDVHGHQVIIYNLDGTTECMHYSVSYNTAGGVWAEGEAPATLKYHDGDSVMTYDKVPTREGYRFIGWQDQDGVPRNPGHLLTEKIDRAITLTALWEKNVTVTVNVVLDHNAAGGGATSGGASHDVTFLLLREENGVNLPVEEKVLTSGYTYDEATNKTTYTVVFTDLPRGNYYVAATKSHYETTITHVDSTTENQIINVKLQYAPNNFDLAFDVIVKADNEGEKALMPQAVNVKISVWGRLENGNLDWKIISQHQGDHAPATVFIDENGRGSGSFPVWSTWANANEPYIYRVEVTSVVMPDGAIVPMSGNHVDYTVDGSGLYQATVSIAGSGKIPTYPDGSNTLLAGSYYDGQQQVGIPTVRMEITPFTVTFDAGDGKVNGQQTLTLNNQYQYPALHDYVAVPNAADKVFVCWTDKEGNPVTNLEYQYLTDNVTYYARYNENITISGQLKVEATYDLNGNTVAINASDRAKTPVVILQKKVGDVYNDIASQKVTVIYEKNASYGTGSYSFADLPNDGTEYRIQVLTLNYDGVYDNDQDQTYTAGEAVAQVDTMKASAQVDVYLTFAPNTYQQGIKVNASQIHEDFRPSDALMQILYRDLGNVYPYQLITQHSVPPYGVMVDIESATASGMGVEDIWSWHTNGTPYEYQVQLSMLYGTVAGAYTQEGTPYTADSPYTVVYGAANNSLKQDTEGGVMLEATLVPKEYSVYMDLNLGNDPYTPILGLEKYMVDDGTGNDQYVFVHTWSYAEQFSAYPYREGYVFKGWTSPNTDDVYIKDGVVYVGNTLANDVTLVAQWEKLSGTDYTILYLEMNTDKVLHGATMVSGAAAGDRVVAADAAVAIEGYVYAGVALNGTFIHKAYNPSMIVTNDPAQNLMVIYYLPDGSDGYTEQVESNLEINKYATLENNGTYTIMLDTYTKDNPITTLIEQNTPLDIVLVLDQSHSIVQGGYLDELKLAVDNFISLVAKHGRANEVDHRIALVGYAGNETSQAFSNTVTYPIAGGDAKEWVNTGVFDSNGDFHPIKVTGFNYTAYNGTVDRNGTYYTYSNGEYLLLTYHDTYYHLITAEEARVETLGGTTVYGYVDGMFVPLTRNSSGLWLYGDKQLYSLDKFFTHHEAVWTHRSGTDRREIHGYTEDGAYKPADNHQGLYVRTETKDANPQLDVYKDALVPVTVGAMGSGGINPGLTKATERLGSNGQTYVQYGIEMANRVFEANPLEGEDADRIRIMVMFTDGMPGSGTFDEDEANAAIARAYETKNTYGAFVYTVGLYPSDGVDATDDEGYFMNGVSSNYPTAKSLNDIQTTVVYSQAPDSYSVNVGGPYFVNVGGNYYELSSKVVYQNKKYWYCWGYDGASGRVEIYETTDASLKNPAISGGKIGDYVIYKKAGGGYQATPYSGYYSTTDSEGKLQQYFSNIVQEITTKITTQIVLESGTILRDIMNEGFVLTDGTVISVYLQEGNFDAGTGTINWSVDANGKPILNPVVELALNSGKTSITDETTGVSVYAYNLDATNPTNPNRDDYHPHAVDITGYNFSEWYISEKHTKGYKMVVTITRVEATDDVEWGISTQTNHEKSGLWLPADENGNRELLLAFDQPTTIFVERAYVLDYGKEFTLASWYFDDEGDKYATPIHIDCDISDGMNWFNPVNPNTANAVSGQYGNTKYGNVRLENGNVIYTPTTMNWGGYDQFYVFGNTWRKTVQAQDANENGNLWNKVTVIPANNIYYEDSFITTESTTQNGIQGFTFTGDWSIVGKDSGNTEIPEHLESAPYGDVHGWTDSLGDDLQFTDGSAHGTGLNGETGAMAEFTFTGTGVEVYTRTNAKSGMVIATLSRMSTSGEVWVVESLAMDNLAVSGDYYHIPTISFSNLPYGTYILQLIATEAYLKETGSRYEYYIDGVRVYNPLGTNTNYQTDKVKDAYGLETNAVFTEVRDILLDYKDFNTDIPDSSDGKMGAVFIDQIKDGQGSGNDQIGTGVYTYEVGTFEAYGPKNEVYLSSGQAVVLKVADGNTYYVGLKSLTGATVNANISGISLADPTTIIIKHSTDMYYRVTPVNGYIVIQNANEDDAILSITNLRTTNLTAPAVDGGVLPVAKQEAVAIMDTFSGYLLEKKKEELLPKPEEPEDETVPSADEQAQANLAFAETLFTDVRQWLEK